MQTYVLTEFSNKVSNTYLNFVGSYKPDTQYLACKTHLGHATRAHTHPIPGVTRMKAAVPSFQVLPDKGWGGVPAPLTDTRVSNRLKSHGHSLTSPTNNSLGFKWRKGGPHLFFLQATPKSTTEGRIGFMSSHISQGQVNKGQWVRRGPMPPPHLAVRQMPLL